MIKKNFQAGFKKVLPFMMFFGILKWIFDFLPSFNILFPKSLIETFSFPDWMVKILGILILLALIAILGFISRQPKVNRYSTILLEPIIYRIPLLNYLYRITNQISDTLELMASFQKVVLVETFPGGYEVGFVTGLSPEEFSKALKTNPDQLITVCISFSPLTSHRIAAVKAERLIEIDISVVKAVTYIITSGIARATSKIIEESHSESGWDFFNFECIVF